MKRTLLSLLMAAPLMVALPRQAGAQTYYYIDNIGVVPAAPTTSDPITITLYGNLSSSNSYIISTSHSVVGNQVNITVNAGAGGIGLPVLVPHNESFNIGMLPAGTYTIVITGVSILDGAPTPEHVFTVSGIGGSPCDSVIIESVEWAPFSDTAIVVHVFNSSSQNFGYPGFVLMDSGGDTLAVEAVNLFGIGPESWHTLTVHPGASIPAGVFTGTLHLWSGFYTEFWCSFTWTGDLCPPASCQTIYPQFAPIISPGTANVQWAISDDQGNIVTTGSFEVNGGSPIDVDTICLPPGVYSLNTPAAFPGPDSSFHFWIGTDSWSIQTPDVIISVDGQPDILEFTLLEQCIDSLNAVIELTDGAALNVRVENDAILINSGDQGLLGEVVLITSDGRIVRQTVSTGSQVRLPIAGLATGVYLVRSSALHAAVRVALDR